MRAQRHDLKQIAQHDDARRSRRAPIHGKGAGP
jgi:hypothetical protein